MARKDELGRRGEQVATEHLEACGFRILDRNWRCPQGELDVVADDGGTLVFVEVKTRSGVGFGDPTEAVTARKLARIGRLAGAWCAEHHPRSRRMRVDVVGIVLPPEGGVRLEHLRGVS
ncbi:YraN family protein [Plantibacter sp. VKM Ac-2880]|uniref:YraN family protein n=1 Tax=Plantibacter sp. VKM Ac-2880 TaxID=2783827 RepID=UPI00188FB513|nr:YraN family protein [Plantibacter sp. VKM Ac-2880]MBF4568892.1 YraN family protein [Plantibacter sp. VKM Ac-2880]